MNAMAFHITMRPSSDTWIAESPTARRRLARLFYSCGNARGLMAFRAADTHIHALCAGPREVAGEFARVAQIAMRQALRLPHAFEPARIRPVETFKHLRSSLAYLLRQAEHHGLGAFDREHEASSLLDLLGMRCIDSQPTNSRLFAALPRLSRAELFGFLGVPLTVAPNANHYLLAAPAVVALPSLTGSRTLARREVRCSRSCAASCR